MDWASDFFSRLGFLLRQRIPLMVALELLAQDAPELLKVRDRLGQGASFSSAFSELDLPRDLLPILAAIESQGLVPEQLEALGACPEASGADPVARVFAQTSIGLEQGQPVGEALNAALRPEDPEELRTAIGAVSRAAESLHSLADAMGRSPALFSPTVRRCVQQMERNGDAATTFRELALALSRGWFRP